MLRERERLITYFAEHEKERRIFQTKFYEIGKLLKVPVSDYIYRLSEVKKKSNTPHYLAIWRDFCRHCFGNFQHYCRS